MKLLLAIGAGGALGAVGRYLVMSQVGQWIPGHFPFGTLAVNILGSFVFGALVETMALVWSVGQEMRAFLVIGVLGAFTTFSTFSLDVVSLVSRGDVAPAVLYAAASVALSLVAFVGGMLLLRAVLA